jgi:hypothetical protein
MVSLRAHEANQDRGRIKLQIYDHLGNSIGFLDNTWEDDWATNTWWCVGITYDGSATEGGFNIYRNADISSSHTYTNTLVGNSTKGTGNFSIGCARVDLDPFWYNTSYLDDIRIYNRAISADDFALIYNLGNGTEKDHGYPFPVFRAV